MHDWLLFAHCTSFLFHCFVIVTASPHHQVTSLTCQVRLTFLLSLITDPFTHDSVYIHVENTEFNMLVLLALGT